MSKELEMVRAMINGANEYEKKTGDKNPPVYFSKNNLLIIEQALKRLEAIDNAKPSEALGIVDKMANYILLDEEYGFIDDEEKQSIIKDRDTIKQALLKAQEPKKYLKWEDLEFKEMYKIIPVRMGDNVYQMAYCLYENEGYIRLEDCQRIYLELFANEKKFFNDLHLERVEE